MFLDQILRVSEVKEFESGLQEHQLAKIPLDRRLVVMDDEEEGGKVTGRKGPENVLDKAVMEHNILACTKVSRCPKFATRCNTENGLTDRFANSRFTTISSLMDSELC
jgi:hypothetical protein